MKILSLLAFILLVNCFYFASANSGITSPSPRFPCSESDKSGCSVTKSCAETNANEATRFLYNYNQSHTFSVFQSVPYSNPSQSNTYAIELFINVDGYEKFLHSISENEIQNGTGSFSFDIPSLQDNLKNCDFSKPVPGYFQLTFDARYGGGQVYYSCVDIFFYNKDTLPTTEQPSTLPGSLDSDDSTYDPSTLPGQITEKPSTLPGQITEKPSTLPGAISSESGEKPTITPTETPSTKPIGGSSETKAPALAAENNGASPLNSNFYVVIGIAILSFLLI
ncbi:hypothetical protein CYY_004790 [Polysphondylium violaceum]|uniref:Carbohydrate binding domain-containing protein n=1 Tax=Polysphondylium violaceum TaxID=133409 RepID=A0A8J4PVX5_9MYCE|nr:hypothetical protein CYY_004790 [Polysphondylium violaceum]